ncbi:MAG: hypothetical protein JXQ93_13880 [Flavobacteriaceae bacterium]
MRTLKTIILLIIMSLYLTSCTDIITDTDKEMLETIENTHGANDTDFTGGSGTDGGGGGKGG